MTVPAKLLSDELASRRGRVPAKVTATPPPATTPGVTGPMVKLGPGAIGTSGAFQFNVPHCGIVHLRVRGTGNVINVAFGEGNSAYALNNGVAPASGAFFEFSFAVDGAESLFVSGTSLTEAACFWRPQ